MPLPRDHTSNFFLETRWGQALDPMFFPMQNFVGFGKVMVVSVHTKDIY